MSRAVFLAAIMAASCIAASAFAETRFFGAIEDLPLAPGLEESATEYGFAGEGGRIIGAAAEGPAAADQVRSFYLQSLPALGWSQRPDAGGEGVLVFLRGREQLSLTIGEVGGGTRLGVRLYVRSPPGD